MSNWTTNGRAAYTGAQARRTTARNKTYSPNIIRRARRHFVITRIDEVTLSLINATAEKWRITQGQAIEKLCRAIVLGNAEQGKEFAI